MLFFRRFQKKTYIALSYYKFLSGTDSCVAQAHIPHFLIFLFHKQEMRLLFLAIYENPEFLSA